jgi:hypothetical protein
MPVPENKIIKIFPFQFMLTKPDQPFVRFT